MITLETGIPGSGKTLYCVDKLLRPLISSTIPHEFEDGETRQVPRRLHSNINGLLLEHEKIGPDQLNNWHTWAKPGDVIVYDEVQKVWPLAATGSKVPACIEALETHRHMGVDFILLTQHPMMIHVNVTRLTGRHLHMRRLGNMGFATVYEWDGCSRTLLYKNSMAKFPYRFGRKAFDLYKSAEVHTKVPRRLPSLIFGVGFAVLAMVFMGPTVWGRLDERLNPQSAVEKAALAQQDAAGGVQAVPVVSQHLPIAPSAPAAPLVVVDGCAASKLRCTCYDSAGKIVPVSEVLCRAGSATAGIVLAVQPAIDLDEVYGRDEPGPSTGQAENDGRIVRSMRSSTPPL